MFDVRKIDCKEDYEYWLETTYAGFSITYGQNGMLAEEEIRNRFEDFCNKEKEVMNPAKSDYTIFVIETKEREYAGILWLQEREKFLDYQGSIAWICNIYIEPEYRKRGLATEMLELAEKWAKKLGLQHIALHVAKTNVKARRLYEKNHYDLVSEKEGSCYYKKLIEQEI